MPPHPQQISHLTYTHMYFEFQTIFLSMFFPLISLPHIRNISLHIMYYLLSFVFQEPIQFGVNLDVTTYTNGVRETHNPVGRAFAPVVWDYFQVVKTSDYIIILQTGVL